MKNCIVIIQDYRTLVVIECWNAEIKWINNLKKNEYVSFEEKKSDKYILKEIQYNKEKNKVILKVKVNKYSKEFSLITEFQQPNENPYAYLRQIENRIEKILVDNKTNTHVHHVVRKGSKQIAKKFGEEAVELVLEANKKDNQDLFSDEAADVFYYFLILVHERGLQLQDILQQLKVQNRKN